MNDTFFPRAIAILCALLFGITAFATEPFFDGLGSYSRKITTDSPKAQRYAYSRATSARISGFSQRRHGVPGSAIPDVDFFNP